jgi:hypothetical protein
MRAVDRRDPIGPRHGFHPDIEKMIGTGCAGETFDNQTIIVMQQPRRTEEPLIERNGAAIVRKCHHQVCDAARMMQNQKFVNVEKSDPFRRAAQDRIPIGR